MEYALKTFSFGAGVQSTALMLMSTPMTSDGPLPSHPLL